MKKRFAIILGQNKKLQVIELALWEDYEWDNFDVIRHSHNQEIVWFSSELEAVAGMYNKFPESLIDSKYKPKLKSNDGEWVIKQDWS